MLLILIDSETKFWIIVNDKILLSLGFIAVTWWQKLIFEQCQAATIFVTKKRWLRNAKYSL